MKKVQSNITPRDLKLKLPSGQPKYWFNGGAVKTIYVNTLNCGIPYAEMFFVLCMKPHLKSIQDRKLKADALNFMRQEANHSKAHYRFYLKYIKPHYPKLKIRDCWYHKIFALIVALVGGKIRVAMVAAAEHFTALSSDMYLSNPDFLKGVDPDLLLIWQWHFIEEIEHKNLCFDVFEAIGGHYVQRVIGFFLSTLFSFTIFFNYFMHMMMVDKLYLKSGFYREFLSFFFGKQGILRLLMIPFLSFLKPSFHPSQYRSEEQKELVKFQLLKIEALLRITASSP